ncbi:hypothetical protein PROFUN_06846 [Planoprotostelium fungivorum]|uniref:Golgi apparatus membrane protein TVP23 homolog n=1 Tax=Planoprotostelium fungivorum TaxID=1890364 RepID=A0A2P6NNF1_9EUKA|nr:hypothetical protein PROFUN_06846 [Planoprotostelium fungivorum]
MNSHNIDVDTNPAYGQTESVSISSFKHPVAVVFHCLFKFLAIILWIISVFLQSSIILTIIFIILAACDFWVVKNVSGRLLVGLRWWNEVKDDGTNEWVFESLENMTTIVPLEKYVFWGAQFFVAILWGVFAILSILSISSWVPIVISLILNLANLSGYINSRAWQPIT